MMTGDLGRNSWDRNPVWYHHNPLRIESQPFVKPFAQVRNTNYRRVFRSFFQRLQPRVPFEPIAYPVMLDPKNFDAVFCRKISQKDFFAEAEHENSCEL